MTDTFITTIPSSGVLPVANLKSLDNWRAFIHQATPVVVTTLVMLGVVTNNQAALWIPLVFAVIDPLLSVMNTTDKIRRVIYGLVGLLQSGGLIAGLTTTLATTNSQIAPVVGAGLTILTSFLARFYTPTTTMLSGAVIPGTQVPLPERQFGKGGIVDKPVADPDGVGIVDPFPHATPKRKLP